MTDGNSEQTPPSQSQPVGVNVPIKWSVPDSIQPQFATHITVQKLTDEYLVSFFRILPPLLVGTPEQIEEQASHIDAIEANCVCQLIVPQVRLKEFIAVLQTATQLNSALPI